MCEAPLPEYACYVSRPAHKTAQLAVGVITKLTGLVNNGQACEIDTSTCQPTFILSLLHIQSITL